VLVWNYRNYGRSQGTPDPYTCYHDAEAVLKFAIKDLGLQGKIGCFGRSLGGTMASHIAKNYPQFIEFLFVDRSLGSLEEISQNMIMGRFNQLLFNIFSRGWVLNSAKNFYEAQCFKMVT
jgi:pimeloyl-ACP methyl ester carboxylesterase